MNYFILNNQQKGIMTEMDKKLHVKFCKKVSKASWIRIMAAKD